MEYKIRINLVSGKQLTFTVDNYETLENGFIKFVDKYTGATKIFDGRNCQIEEVLE